MTQLGALALALILGRPLADDEYPARIADIVNGVRAISATGLEPLPAGVHSWLSRALQLDARRSFAHAGEALVELAGIADSNREHAALESFLAQCYAARMSSGTRAAGSVVSSIPSHPKTDALPEPRAARPTVVADKPATMSLSLPNRAPQVNTRADRCTRTPSFPEPLADGQIVADKRTEDRSLTEPLAARPIVARRQPARGSTPYRTASVWPYSLRQRHPGLTRPEPLAPARPVWPADTPRQAVPRVHPTRNRESPAISFPTTTIRLSRLLRASNRR